MKRSYPRWLPLVALAIWVFAPLASASTLGEKTALAEQAAAQNAVAGPAAANIANALAGAFGANENVPALIDAARRLSEANPAQAEAIAAAATVFAPTQAPAIAAAVAAAVPSSAAAVAAAAAQVAPAAAAEIAGAVAAAVPAAAAQIAQSVSQVVPGSAAAIAAAIIAAVPTANAAAVQAAANAGVAASDTGGGGSTGGSGVAPPSGGGGGGGSANVNPTPAPSPGPQPPPPPPVTTLVVTDSNYAQVTQGGVITKFPFDSFTTVVVETSADKPVQFEVFEAGTLLVQGKPTAADVTVDRFSGGTINISKDNDVTLKGGAGSGTITGAGGVIKDGSQSLTLGGSNTYTGGTTVMNGALILTPDATLPEGGDLNVQGGQLNLGGNADPQKVGQVSLSGGTIANGSLDADSYSVSGGAASASLGGAGALTKTGDGTVTLSGANTYSGGTTVSGGTLAGNAASLQGAIANNANVAFEQAAAGTYAGAMTGSGTMAKTGDGTLTLSGANTYSGGTTVSGGTLAGNAASLQGAIANNANVNFNQTTPGTYAGAMSGTGTLTKNDAGALTLTGSNNYAGGTTVNAGTVIGFAGNEVVASSLQGNVSAAVGTTVIFRQPLGGDDNFAGNYSGVVSGAGQLRFEEAGTVNVSAAQMLTGATFIVDGANVTLAADVGRLSASSALTIDGGLLNLGGNTQTIAGLSLLGGGEIDGGVLSSSGVLALQAGTINAAITAASGLTKTGSGVVILGGDNTFVGPTTISGGTLRLTADQALSPNSSVSVAGISSVLDLGGGAANSGAVTLDSGGVISNGVLAASAFNLNNGEVSASLAGNGQLNVTGSVTLSGNNRDFLGQASVTTGTLLLANDDALSGTASVTVGSGGTLDIGAGAPALNVLNMNGGTLTTANGSNGLLELTTVNVNGASTLNARLSADSLAINTTGSVTIGRENVLAEVSSVTLAGNGILNIGAFNQNLPTGTFTLTSGTISGTTGTLTAGTFNLASGTVGVNLAGSGAINITGVVALNGSYSGFTGNVSVKNSGSLTGSLASLGGNLEVLAGGTAAFSGAGTFAGVISGEGTLTKTAPGVLVLAGDSSGFAGTVNVVDGGLSGAPNNLPANVNISAGASLGFIANGTYAGTISGDGIVSAATGITLALSGDISGHLGSLDLASGSSVALSVAGTETYSAALTGNGSLILSGAGNLTLDGNNAAFGGTTEVNSGTLTLGNTSALGGSVTVAGGTLATAGFDVTLTNLTISGGDVVGSGTLTAGSFVFNIAPDAESSVGGVTLAGAGPTTTFTKTGEGRLILGEPLAGIETLVVQAGRLSLGDGINHEVATVNLSGGTIAGTGTLTATDFVVSGGTILTSTAATGQFRVAAGSVVELLGQSNTFSSNVIMENGAQLNLYDNNFTPGINFLAAVPGDNVQVTLLGAYTQPLAPFARTTASASTPTEINAVFGEGVVLVLAGNATYQLTGVGSNPDSITVIGATLLIEDGSSLGSGQITVNGGTLDVSTTTTFDRPIELTNNGTITGSGGVNLANLTITQGILDITLSGTAPLLVKSNNILTLTKANNYTGGTTVESGATLVLGNADALPLNNVQVAATGTLAVRADGGDLNAYLTSPAVTLATGARVGFDTSVGDLSYDATTLSVNRPDLGVVVLGSGAGVFTLNGNNSYQGGTRLLGGITALGGNSALPSGQNLLVQGGTLNVNGRSVALGGGAITLSSGSIIDGAEVAGSLAASSITKEGAGRFTMAANVSGPTTVSAGILQIGAGAGVGSLTGTASIAAGAQLEFNRAGEVTYAGGISGAGSLVKTGPGSLVLSGSNAPGATIVSGGSIALGLADSLSGVLTVNTGGTFNIAGFNNTLSTVSLNGGTLSGTSGTLTATAFNVQSGAINAALAGSLAKSTTGTVTVGAAGALNALTSLSITAGTVDIGTFNQSVATGTVTLAGGSLTGSTGSLSAQTLALQSGTLGAVLAGAGTINKTTDGTVAITKSSGGAFTGQVNVSGGVLAVQQPNTLAGSLAVSNGATLDIGNTTQTLTGSVQLLAGSIEGTMTSSLNAPTFDLRGGVVSAVLVGTGALQISGGEVNLTRDNTFTGATTISAGGSLTLGNANGLASSSSVSVSVGGTLNVGALTANVGNLTLAGGTLSGTSSGRLSSSGTVTLDSGSVSVGLAGSAQVVVNGTFTFNRVNTYSGGTVIGSAASLTLGVRDAIAGALTVNGGTLNVGSNPQTLGLVTLSSGVISGDSTITSTVGYNLANGSVSAPLAGVGPVNITAGQVTLTGLNVFTGTTTINAGATLVGTVSSISSPQVVNNGQLRMTDDTNRNFAAAITGSGGFVKEGTGTITLSGANTYSGGTTISAGGLAGTTSSLQGNIINNGSVSFNQGINGTYGATLSGTGSVAKLGGGAVTLSGNNTYTGQTTIGGGTLFVEGNQSAATGAVTVAAGATLGGKGTIGGATSIVGLHRMGASQTGSAPGIQTFTQSLTYQTGAQAFWRLTANTDALALRGTAYDGVNITGALQALTAASVTFNLSFNAPGSTVNWADTFWDLNQGAVDPKGWLVYDAGSLNITGLPNLNDPSLWVDSQGQALGAVRPDYAFAFFVDEDNSDVYLNYIYRRAP